MGLLMTQEDRECFTGRNVPRCHLIVVFVLDDTLSDCLDGSCFGFGLFFTTTTVRTSYFGFREFLLRYSYDE